MSLEAPEKRELNLLMAYAFLALIALLIAYLAWNTDSAPILAIWLLGAAGLGLVTGFVTGASQQAGAAAQLLAFISGGIIVPILGGVVSLLQPPETTSETGVLTSPAELHSLWVAGSFFVAYSVFAIIGIAVGVRRRNEKVNNLPGGINFAP